MTAGMEYVYIMVGISEDVKEVWIMQRREILPKCPTFFIHTAVGFLYALAAFVRLFLTTSLRCFFATMTLNRSKSFSDRLCSMAARFLAHDEDSHLATRPSFSTCLRMTPDPAPRGSFVRARGVRVRWR